MTQLRLLRRCPALLLLIATGCGQFDPHTLSYAVKRPAQGGSAGASGESSGGQGSPMAGTGGVADDSGAATGGSRLDGSLDAAKRPVDARIHDERTREDHSETADVAHPEAGPITRPEAGPTLPPGFDDTWDGQPLCNGYAHGPPWTEVTDVAPVTFVNDTACCAVYAVLKSHYVVAAWPLSLTSWAGWECMDYVPGAERLTVVNLQHFMSEAFVLGDGLIWVRHEYKVSQGGTMRSTWLHVARPSGIAEVRDIHAFVHFVPGSTKIVGTDPQLLALSENAVFIRSRQDPEEPFSPFAEWRKVAPVLKATRVCGGFTSDAAGGHIEVYAVGEDGSLLVSKSTTSDASAGTFSGFNPVAPPFSGVSEIECVIDDSRDLQVFARTQSGGLYWSIPSSKDAKWAKFTEPVAAGPALFAAATPLLNTQAEPIGAIKPFWVRLSDGWVSQGGSDIFRQPLGEQNQGNGNP